MEPYRNRLTIGGRMENTECVIFRYSGKYAHFLKAEANASAPTYPFPPRTALLGLIGAVLGFEKDSCQIELKNANIAVSGGAKSTHWHMANLRKDPPGLLPYSVTKREKGSSKNQRNTRIIQEWLFEPNFIVYAQLPGSYHKKICDRLKNRKWHFSPCLGLSEMLADLEYMDNVKTALLPKGTHEITTVVRKDEDLTFDVENLIKSNAAAKSIRMPRDVDPNRVFMHETYLYEINGKPLSVKTKTAVQAGDNKIVWL